MNTVKLNEVACADIRWMDCAQGIVHEGWSLDEIADDEAHQLQSRILSGLTTLDELRAGVQWASALDREAVEVYGANLTDGDQLLERIGRRVMHQAGRVALNAVKSKKRRQVAYAKAHLGVGRVGMGGLETHDYHATTSQDLVQ